MKKRLVLTAMFGKVALATVLAVGLALAGCDTGSGGGGGGGSSESGDPITPDLYGTYRVTSPSDALDHTITVGPGTWSMSGRVVSSYGTYTLSADQRTATLYAYDIGGTVGTVYINGTILTGILNSASGYPGTYKAEKVSD